VLGCVCVRVCVCVCVLPAWSASGLFHFSIKLPFIDLKQTAVAPVEICLCILSTPIYPCTIRPISCMHEISAVNRL
jgi:hypothetical protein